MPSIPLNVSEITPELVTALLQEKHPGTVVESLELTEYARCGDGKASTADRIGFRLKYREGSNRENLPEWMKMKSIFLNPAFRFGLPIMLATARTVNFLEKLPLIGRVSGTFVFSVINLYQRYFPHAPEAMYRNEVNFYGKLRGGTNIEAPACYASAINDHDGQFGILMEDLNLRGAHFPNAVEGVSLGVMRNMIRNLARLHAHYWESPRFKTDLSWLATTHEGGMFPVFDAIGLNLIRDQVAKNPFKQKLLAPLNCSVDRLWQKNWQSQHIIYRQPHTVLHGDTHIGNTYVLPDNTGGLLDFQLMVRGPWCHDLTYLIITGLGVEERRTNERALLRLYIDTLMEHGVKNVPTEAQAWLLYRQTAIWGLVIGWLITPPQNYGEAITSANIGKIVTAMLDLDALASLEE